MSLLGGSKSRCKCTEAGPVQGKSHADADKGKARVVTNYSRNIIVGYLLVFKYPFLSPTSFFSCFSATPGKTKKAEQTQDFLMMWEIRA